MQRHRIIVDRVDPPFESREELRRAIWKHWVVHDDLQVPLKDQPIASEVLAVLPYGFRSRRVQRAVRCACHLASVSFIRAEDAFETSSGGAALVNQLSDAKLILIDVSLRSPTPTAAAAWCFAENVQPVVIRERETREGHAGFNWSQIQFSRRYGGIQRLSDELAAAFESRMDGSE